MNLSQAVEAYQTIIAQLTDSERTWCEEVRAAVLSGDQEFVDMATARISSLEVARDYAENLILTRNA